MKTDLAPMALARASRLSSDDGVLVEVPELWLDDLGVATLPLRLLRLVSAMVDRAT